MKSFHLLVLTSLLTINCSAQKSKLQIVEDFYKASNAYNFSKILSCTYDTVTIKDGTYMAKYDRKAYHDIFQWDSVFTPKYLVVLTEAANDDVFVKISTQSKRFEFLGNSPLVTTHRISFTNNKISTIELIEYVGADFNIWTDHRDKLVAWIKINHPELNEFIHKMDKKGAENYLKAIQLYKKK